MKKLLILFLVAVATFTSCTTIESGHKGVIVEFGKVSNNILSEGFHWITPWFDVVEYDIREKTMTSKFEFNDKNNMLTPVTISFDYALMGDKVNTIHSKIGLDQLEAKITTTAASAAKQVIPSYSASELNLNKREEAEQKLYIILKAEFPDFYVNCSRVRITDVDIPTSIAKAAEQNAAQIERNNLSEKKVQEAKNNLEAAKFDSEAKAILSRPEMLALKKLEVEAIWASKGVSPYGNNNVFGSETAIVRGLK